MFRETVDFEDSQLTLSDMLNYLNHKQWSWTAERVGMRPTLSLLEVWFPWEQHTRNVGYAV